MPKDISFRVALLGIYHESNTFIDRPTTLQDFKNGHLLKGEAIRQEYINAYHEIGGMLEVMDKNNIEVIPVMFAEATPGGCLTKETFETLLQEMMEELQKHLPVDACLVAPHGAGVANGYDDMDGHWLKVLRMIVGDHVPIIGTLDPHANVSKKMCDATNALIAYKTNPHVDQRETGRAAAALLVQVLNDKVSPVQLLVQTPVAISIEQQNTSLDPCKSFHALAKEIGEKPNILSVSLLLGFPYADVADMGSAFIIIGNDLADLATYGNELKAALINNREKCVGQMQDIYSVLPVIKEKAKPVLLLDMGDNIGGGSPGDSTYLLNAIEKDGSYTSLHCIYDPESVKIASTYEPGNIFNLNIGNVKLISKGDGKFTEEKPRHGGQVNFDMGAIAVVSTIKGNVILFNSLRVPPFSSSQVTSFNIDPTQFDIIVAKGVNAPIAAYSAICPTIIQVNTPGVTQADMTLFPFRKRRVPLFPFEKNIG